MTGEFIVAVHSLVFLNHKHQSMTSEQIADNVCTNPARIRKVMAKLKKADLIVTKEGSVKGGYSFVKNSADITLFEIFKAVDKRAIEPPWASGDPDMECLIASGMARIMNGVFEKMDRQCIEVLKQTTIYDIDKQIFTIDR